METLSLSRTGVTNEGLYILGDFERTSFARNLRTLNLSQCRLVSDKGVKCLSGKTYPVSQLQVSFLNVVQYCRNDQPHKPQFGSYKCEQVLCQVLAR